MFWGSKKTVGHRMLPLKSHEIKREMVKGAKTWPKKQEKFNMKGSLKVKYVLEMGKVFFPKWLYSVRCYTRTGILKGQK